MKLDLTHFPLKLTPILIGVEYSRLWAPTGEVIGVNADARAVVSGFPGNAVVSNLPPSTAIIAIPHTTELSETVMKTTLYCLYIITKA